MFIDNLRVYNLISTKPNIYINKLNKNNMKKGDFSFETIVKIILALLVLLFIIGLIYIIKPQIYDIFNSIVKALRLG